jgi:hypothetical protein
MKSTEGTGAAMRPCRFANIAARVIAAVCALACTTAQATLIHGGTAVSDVPAGSTFMPNAYRSVAVGGPDDSIYVLFVDGANALRIARSTDGGASFQPSVVVPAPAPAGSIAVGDDGTVYVVAVGGSGALLRSFDGGLTFVETPLPLAPGSPLHVAVDGAHVYVLDANFLYSSADGGASFDTTVLPAPGVFTDVHVNPYSGQVVIHAENANYNYFVSNDHGATLIAPFTPPVGPVFYTSSALSWLDPAGTLVIAGMQAGPDGNNSGTVIDLANGASASYPFGTAVVAQSRQLVADGCGNVVDGYNDGIGAAFHVSQDVGMTFGPVQQVPSPMGQLAIDTSNQQVLFAYNLGSAVVLDVHGDLLGSCPGLDLTLVADDFSGFARYGQTVSYVVEVINTGEHVFNDLVVTGSFSAAFDESTATWSCEVGACGSGSGAFSDTIDLPAHGVVIWNLAVALLPDTPEGDAVFTLSTSALPKSSVVDTDVLVLMRDGFDGVAP